MMIIDLDKELERLVGLFEAAGDKITAGLLSAVRLTLHDSVAKECMRQLVGRFVKDREAGLKRLLLLSRK